MRAGDDSLRAFFRLLDVHDVDLHIVAFLDVLGADLLALREHGLGLADFQRERAGLRIHALNQRADELLMAALEFLHHLAALAVADALADDVSRGLRRNAAKLLRIETVAHKAAELCAGVILLRDLERDLAVRVLRGLDDLLAQKHVKLALLRIHIDDDVLVAVAVLAGGDDRRSRCIFMGF